MKIIGISGKLGCGKTVVGSRLVELLGDGWQRLSFGDVLKQEVSEKFNFPLEWCYENKDRFVRVDHELAPALNMTVREILQWWGTDIRRKENPKHWCLKMTKKLVPLVGNVTGVIIDDVRFQDEAELVKYQNGVLIRLNPYQGYEPSGQISEHSSETALDNYANWDIVSSPDYGTLESEALFILKKLADSGWFGSLTDRLQKSLKWEAKSPQGQKPKVVCLCGSTRFSEAFKKANLEETLAGRIVLSIGCDFKSDDALGLQPRVKTQLDNLHLWKIDLADEVLILNVGGYIGESTARELSYARRLSKTVRSLQPINSMVQ